MPNLAYDDLDYYLSGAQIEALEDVIDPIAGTASLLVRRVSGGASTSCNFAPKTPDFPQGLARGLIQSRVDNPGVGNGGNSDAIGLLCMQSQRDMSVGGSAYGLHWHPIGDRLQLFRWSASDGLINATGRTNLVDINPFTAAIATLLLAWRYDASNDRVFLYGYTGLLTDFSDMTLQLSYVDNSGNLTTHVTEGGYVLGASGSDYDLRFDNMTLKGPA